MEDLQALITVIVQLMQIQFTIWGFTLSWWDILLCVLIGSVVIFLLGRFFSDD